MGRILVLNAGSSSIKFRVVALDGDAEGCDGELERIGEGEARLRHRVLTSGARSPAAGQSEWVERAVSAVDHREGLALVFEALDGLGAGAGSLDAIGHRVVHGGDRFHGPALVDSDVLEAIRALGSLAPLHNPANLLGIEIARELRPGVPQVAVFDTAFHHTLEPHAFHYAIPRALAERHAIRRYGFHGTSHGYVARRAAEHLRRPLASLNLITLHLGNGASAAAIRRGRSVDTSMGLTPLEGLVMGTRSGDLDPAIVIRLAREARLDIDQLEALLNEQSGLEGLCGASDLREVEARAARGDRDAGLALDVYAHRVRKYLGAYLAVLGRVDAIVFTAGVGENSAEMRARCCIGLEALGIEVDPVRNRAPSREERAIHGDASRIAVLVIPTDEEREIATQTRACVEEARARAKLRAPPTGESP